MKPKKFMVLLAVMALVLSAGLAYGETDCPTVTWNLYAGQTKDVGSVSVTNDDAAKMIYVTYTLDAPGATFGELHLWVGTDLTLMPQTPKGAPIPGQFCQVWDGFCFNASGLTEYTFAIPYDKVDVLTGELTCGSSVFVVPHAEVFYAAGGNDTAFGGCIGINIKDPGRWWYYCTYELCCGGPPPPGECYRETAFAKGGYVFTTDKKSNPENLPSLNLIKNRWGWAINLTQTGTTTYDIWAGAGLNKTANGKLVGTLTVNWDGSNVTAIYSVIAGYYLEEVHLYAGDSKPTTVAPGQYGNLAGDLNQAIYTFEDIPVADNDSGGIWLIGHAIVTNGKCELP